MAEWVVAIASIVGLLSLFFLWEQLRLLGEQLKLLTNQISESHRQLVADHERSRREMSIELMRFWCTQANSTNPYFVCGRRIVQELDEKQCKKLANLEPFTLEEKFKHLIEGFRADFAHRLPKDGDNGENGNTLLLNKAELVSLRTIVVTYLNSLETVATAWRHSIADREIIEEEFQKIVSPDTHEFVLESYRKVSGVYPSIRELTKTLKEKNERGFSKHPVV